jgi:WD40 repeat protein
VQTRGISNDLLISIQLESGVESVALSTDGKHIVSGSHDNTVRVWDVLSGEEAKKLVGHTSSVRSVAFSTDGKHIVSGSDDHTVQV